ncbi:MEDS domain-containing protein [Streptomyces sp. SID13726]|uniref:MEDS domain-containing protein n=1 Tax=Streptomyces sp. SID13726 TaxID=2706058 RepID=UPI0013B76DF8|nr:MEDS domain-containing protein [Streptomyces sp. SID13726]NEB06364.1 hypothetical protein [Streptomyces sp. SID13726]
MPTHPTSFDHRMTVYATDNVGLAAALPFLTEALDAPEEPPPVAIASAHNLGLVRDALAQDAQRVTLIDHTDWYTGSAANAVAQSAGYLAAHAAPGGRIHLLMEPVWNGRAGRSPRETTEWIRYEALANLLFAPLATTALCAYDTRTAGPAIIDAARRAHPDTGVYEDPVRLAAELDAVPLPPPAPDAELLTDLTADAVARRTRDRGLAAADAELFATAVAEAAEAVGAHGGDALLWGRDTHCVCELRSGRRLEDPLVGFVPPDTTDLEPGQGLWYARQVCAYVDVRNDRDGSTVRLQYA